MGNVAPFYRNKLFGPALGLAIAITGGLYLDLMDVDASQYASIAQEMLRNGSWLEVMHRGDDYLDKPPLVFWSGALSFSLFGVSNWAFKLPSLFAALAGVYAVYRFGRLFYSEKTAQWAAFILFSSIGFLLLCNDIRTDTLLMGFSAVALWQFAAYLEGQGNRYLIGAFAAASLAMLAKGPIGLIAPGFGVAAHLALHRRWRDFFRPQWLLGLGIIALMLAPMCWGLYHQFDLHPEKEVNERTGVSGLYFYFWEQSFGRITGENVWHNDAPWYYFVHVYLWAFLPWGLLLYPALWQKLQMLFKARFRLESPAEGYSVGAFVLTFAALSMSRYKLPHYIFITLPWASVLVAQWLSGIKDRSMRLASILQYITLALMLAVVAFIAGFVFPQNNLFPGLAVAGVVAWLVFDAVKKNIPAAPDRLMLRGGVSVATAALVLNYWFYPHLLPYQSTAIVPRMARSQGIPADHMVWFQRHGHALDFYNGDNLEWMRNTDDIERASVEMDTVWVYTNNKGKKEITAQEIPYRQCLSFGHFQVALLNLRFLNPATRDSALEQVYLLEVPPFKRK